MPANDITIKGAYTTGINSITIENTGAKYFSLDGKPLDKPQKGINIVRLSNGKTRKIVVK